MPQLLDLDSKRQQKLFEDLSLLSFDELQPFCQKHSIPYHIYIQTKNDAVKTSDLDSKEMVLKRIKYYLQTGKVQKETIFPSRVVNVDKVSENLKPTDKIYYGQYKKGNRVIKRVLTQITKGQFKFGEIDYDLIRSYWLRGEIPTYQEFALSWVVAVKKYKPHIRTVKEEKKVEALVKLLEKIEPVVTDNFEEAS